MKLIKQRPSPAMIVALVLGVTALALASAPAGTAAVPEPPDPEANVTYPIPNGFMWWMPPRFGLDENKDGIVDYHYDQAWVRATSFKVDFNGCTSAAERQASTTTNRYRFTIDGAASTFANACKVERSLAEGAHTVVLDVESPTGGSLGHFEQSITVEDRLIATIGDSFGSGEGNPDIPRKWAWVGGKLMLVSEAKWVDRRCHRSATAGAAQAAIDLEFDDPHSSVTFFSLACSGATISTPDPDNPANGTGLLGPYIGAEPGPNPNPPMLPPQVDQLRDIVAGGTAYPQRQIDDLVISIGGNDMQFVKLIMECTLSMDCYKDPNIAGRLAARKAELPGRYDDLSRALDTVPIRPGHTFITEYPNLTLQDNGQFCGTTSTWWNEPLMIGLTQPEVRWMYEQLLVPMNRQIMPDRAAAHGWTFVGGVMDQFGVVGQSGGHGYCANDSWLRHSFESVLSQGPDLNPLATKGTIHPNARGQEVYKQRILAALRGGVDADAPTHALSASHDRQTVVFSNSWAVGTCDDTTGRCFSGLGVPKVTIHDPDGIAYTNIYVNGVRGDGCTSGKSIDDTTWEWYPCLVSWTPVSEIRSVATDRKGNTSTRTFQVKSDLTTPTASATPSRPPLVDGFYAAPVDVKLSGAELWQAAANSGVSYMRYQVDGGPWQQIGSGGTVSISTEGTHVINYHAVDFAGRESGKAMFPNDPEPIPDQPLAIKLDLSPPTASATLTAAPNAAGWTKDTTTVDFAASDGSGSGVKEIVYSATGAQPMATRTVPFEFASVDVTAPGTTTITYQARDRVGNLSAPKTVTVKLDKAPPAASLTSPAEGNLYRSGTISMGGTASDALSGLARVEFLVDGSVVATDQSAPYSFAVDSSTIPDGIRLIALRAVDVAGNASVSAHTVYVNRTSNTYLRGRPAHTTSSTAATFAFSAWNTAATYECSLDGAAFAACASPKSYTNLALGKHTFRVRSTAAGVLDATPAEYTWLIEPTSPARTTLASVGPPAASEAPSTSATGRFVAFQTGGALVAADTNNVADVYVRDRDPDRDGIFDEAGATAIARISVRSDGAQATGASRAPAISADGRYVAFTSDAANLVAGDTNARSDVFLRDRDADGDGVFDESGATSTIRISVSSTGVQGNANAEHPAISGDGRYVAFDSLAAGLAAGANGYFQVYAYDRVTKRLALMSEAADGKAGVGNSNEPAFSADGRYIAFVSNAANLASASSAQNDVYVRDRDSDHDGVFDEPGATQIVKMSYSLDGGAPNGYVLYRPAISATGRFVAFESGASNLVAGDTNGVDDVFVRDRDGDRDGIFDEPRSTSLTRVSISTTEIQANRTSGFPDGVAISGDGRYVAFASLATNLAADATSGNIQVLLRDRKTARTQLGGVTASGAQGSLRSISPALASNGAYLAFASDSVNMTPDDTSSDLDVFTTKVDLVAPETTITDGPRFFTTATTGTFAWTASEDGVTFTCSLDHAAYVPCSSPRPVGPLALGEHVFQVRATDASGNTDPTPEAREWVVR